MTLHYTIEDCEGYEVVAEFEFHKEINGDIVFDGAWTAFGVLEHDGIWGIMPTNIDQMIHRWLAKGGEDKIYRAAERELS